KVFKAAHRISFDNDHPHVPGTRPHDQVGGLTVDVCFRLSPTNAPLKSPLPLRTSQPTTLGE
ncbi:MAG TPA: hypothetical protein VJ645_02400, partial [Gaiellaceae bacterium]|nr:hypothetical protein [Gaiellaceae bacterium]